MDLVTLFFTVIHIIFAAFYALGFAYVLSVFLLSSRYT